MYSLIVQIPEWKQGQNSISRERFLEFTEDKLVHLIRHDASYITDNPVIFMSESDITGQPNFKIGKISNLSSDSRYIRFKSTFTSESPFYTNNFAESIANELDIDDFEFSRGHWSVKDVDLYDVLLRNSFSSQSEKYSSSKYIDVPFVNGQIAVMMPFESSFTEVYDSIQAASSYCGMNSVRADDIWNHESIIEDIFSLIASSRIVICDCTGRNPNVFYEAGIAKALGSDIIFITQNKEDIPFDIRHIRYIHYLNNKEGLMQLNHKLSNRIHILKSNHSIYTV